MFDSDLYTEAYTEAMKITPQNRRRELYDVFIASGYQISADKKKVTGVQTEDASLKKLSGGLRNKYPVAFLAVKRVLGKHNVHI